jgi:hypothetical protein
VIAHCGYSANRIRAAPQSQGAIPVILDDAAASARSNMTNAATRTAGESRPCSAASGTLRASPPAKTSSPHNFLSAVSLASAFAFWI